jgi:hypothetical protein
MRTKRPPLKLARDRLSTIAWIHAVRSSAAITDGVPPNIDSLGLQKALVRKHRKRFRSLHRSHRIRDYFSGRTTPGSSTLRLFEQVYPGSREVFEHGPDRSHLWDATFCRDPESAKSVSFDLKRDIQHGVPAENSVRRRRSSKLPRVERVLIPDSLARAFRVSESARLDVASAKLARSLQTNPRLADSLSTFVDGENALHVDGPLVQIIPDVTFSAKAPKTKRVCSTVPTRRIGLANFARQDQSTKHCSAKWMGHIPYRLETSQLRSSRGSD